MKPDLSTIWAIGATAIALVLAGMQLERLTSTSNETTGAAARAEATEPGGARIDDHLDVPDWLSVAPKEWRTPSKGTREGYAMLLDSDRRSLLIDFCVHHGFFDEVANQPVEPQGPQCERVLTAILLEFTDDGVIAQLHDGQTVDVGTSLHETDGGMVLDLSFDGRRLQLIPGQTNDLFSDIANMPQMQAERQQLFEFSQQQQRQQRAQLADAGNEVPRFTVPDSALEKDGAAGKSE